MRTSTALAALLSACFLAGTPALASAQEKGQGKSEQRGGGPDRGERGGPDRGDRERGGPGRDRGDDRGGRPDRGPDRERGPQRADRGPERDRPAPARVDRRDDDRRAVRDLERRLDDRRAEFRDDRRDAERDWRRAVERRIERRDDDDAARYVWFDNGRDRGLIRGCPPGLAWRDNGCLPPGQARQIARARYDYLWDRRDDDYRYRYDDGYLYRTSSTGSLLGYLPVLGGALGLGNLWPQQYQYQAPPPYYSDYYGLDDGYDYRYADGVVYGLNPQTSAINQVAALLTGQTWTIGQPAPAGYDVYNVPYAYRDQYADGPDRRYRYSDGYVYQMDPTTQLVQAVIQLIA